ncbi:MAG: hypothetical protein K2H33_08850, partial [Muribaculaceae bacterium]|nr:hypothetical protein [Muribaculaceae bacterium]
RVYGEQPVVITTATTARRRKNFLITEIVLVKSLYINNTRAALFVLCYLKDEIEVSKTQQFH